MKNQMRYYQLIDALCRPFISRRFVSAAREPKQPKFTLPADQSKDNAPPLTSIRSRGLNTIVGV